MDDAALEAAGQLAGQIVDPFRLETVLAQRLVLGADLTALLVVRGEAEAAGAAKRVAAERLHAVECPLRPGPHPVRVLASVRPARDVVA